MPAVTFERPNDKPRFDDPATPEEIARHREQQRSQLSRTSVLNGPAVLDLGATQIIRIAGVTYRVPPLSFEHGTRLQQYMRRIAHLREETESEQFDEFAALLREITALFRHIVTPVKPLRRLLWKLGLPRFPFARLSEGECGELIGFFLTCRMKSRVSLPATQAARA